MTDPIAHNLYKGWSSLQSMANRKTSSSRSHKLLLIHLRELQVMLNEMNQKLDHLIHSCRKFYFTNDFSYSSNHEFKG